MTQTPFEFASNFVHIIGWPVIVYLAWRASNVFTKATTQREGMIKKFDDIHKAVTNHLGHEIVAAVKEEGKETRECIRDHFRNV